MLDPDTARAQAFESLIGVSLPVREALDRVNRSVAKERDLTSGLRTPFTRTQRTALEGSVRFAAAVDEVGRAVVSSGRATRVSTPAQELQNIFLWLVDGRYIFRIKHDLDDVEDPGSAHLFSVVDPGVRETVFLTWGVTTVGEITGPAFATVEEPRWTILLAQLLAARERHAQITAKRRGPNIHSSKGAHEAAQDDS